MIYPKKIAIPVTAGDGEIWTQVYVPVMEAVSAGSGEQYARLQLDWSSLTLVSNPTEPSTETPSTGQPSTEQPGNNGNQNPSSEKADKSAYIPCCYRRPVYPEERMYIQKRVWKH